MITGIYALYLGEPGRYYIGQGNIIERITQHKSKLKCNKHYNYKLQQAYNKYHTFYSISLAENIDIINLDPAEEWFMELFDAINTGYNIAAPGTSGRGIEHASSIYSKEQIISVLFMLLDTNNTMEHISSITGVSSSTVRHISRREVHKWLDEEYPEETKLLKEYSTTRIRNAKPTSSRKFNSLKAPDGTIYPNITIISAFSREHNLNSNLIGSVLRGDRNSHAGWVGINIIEN